MSDAVEVTLSPATYECATCGQTLKVGEGETIPDCLPCGACGTLVRYDLAEAIRDRCEEALRLEGCELDDHTFTPVGDPWRDREYDREKITGAVHQALYCVKCGNTRDIVIQPASS